MAELQSKFAITWECVEPLLELGGGSTVPLKISKVQSKSSLSSKVFPASSSASPEMMNSIGRRGKERASTLGGEEQKPTLPENDQKSNTMPATPRDSGEWSGTSDKGDLNSRQLLLLREMQSIARRASWGGSRSLILKPAAIGRAVGQREAPSHFPLVMALRTITTWGPRAIGVQPRNGSQAVHPSSGRKRHQNASRGSPSCPTTPPVLLP